LELREPPTYIRLVWDPERGDIPFYASQRRYIRIETDANSVYHNPNNPETSRINIIASGPGLLPRGSTPLQGGRMRAIFECPPDSKVGSTGSVRVELSRTGLPVLADERPFRVVPPPAEKPKAQQLTLPKFEVRAISPDDPRWIELGWPENPALTASAADIEDGVLVIYYSTAYPKYASQRAAFEQRDPALAASFTSRYEIWLAVHSLLHYQDELSAAGTAKQVVDEMPEVAEEQERQERRRIATLAAMFASREVQQPPAEVVEAE
jgi:hypothetical protein